MNKDSIFGNKGLNNLREYFDSLTRLEAIVSSKD